MADCGDGISRYIVQKYRQQGSYRPDATEFNITVGPTTDDYIDWSKSYVYLRCQVVKATDGTAMADDAVYAVINNFGHTFFREIEVDCQGEKMLVHNQLAHRAQIENLLSYGASAQKSWGSIQMSYPDTHGQFNTLTDANNGFKFRKGAVSKSKKFETYARPVCYPFNVSGPLPNGIHWRFTLRRNSDDLLLMCAADLDCKIIVDEIYLEVMHVKMQPKALEHLNGQFRRGLAASFHFEQGGVETYHLEAGKKEFRIDNNLNRTLRPNFLILAMVSERAFNGERTLNPFQFQPFNIERCQVSSGDRNAFDGGLEFNMGEGRHLSGYFELQKALAFMEMPDGVLITRNSYDNGLFVIAVNVKDHLRDRNDQKESSDPTLGNHLQVHLKFRQVLPENVVLLCLMSFDNVCIVQQPTSGRDVTSKKQVKLDRA